MNTKMSLKFVKYVDNIVRFNSFNRVEYVRTLETVTTPDRQA